MVDRIEQNSISLRYKKLEENENLYEGSDMRLHDIVDAEYLAPTSKLIMPDILALPNPTIQKTLLLLNTKGVNTL